MGYNATYGLPYNDDMSTYEVPTKHPETESFLEQDVQGNLIVKREYAHCDICGKKIEPTETAYLHYSYMYCRACEYRHRNNERKQQIKNRKNKKAVAK